MVLYQNTSNYGPGVEISPMLWVLGFPIEIKREIFKNLLVSIVRARAYIFGMLQHLVVLYQNTSHYGPGVEISPMLWGLRFDIEIKKEIFKNLLVPNRKC